MEKEGDNVGDWLDEGGTGSRIDATAFFDSKAGDALIAFVDAGALVSVGQTSDGGALGITVTVDGRWRREYFRDPEEFCSWAADGLPAVRDAVEQARASSARGKRDRRSRGL